MFAINQRNFRIYWLGGLLLFAAVVVAGAPLSVPGVPSGMGDHQAATTASNVNAIHAAWQAAGLLGTAKLAMVIDLIFIGIYSFGAFQGGQLFRKMPSAAMRRLGSVVTVAAIVFFVTDYAETISQLIQLLRFSGSDMLAGIAAFVRPIKMLAFLVSFIGILAGLLLQRRLNSGAK
ncbi:MAG: hypothetical protein V3V15_07625 [Sphingorhabdus sp.]